MLSPSNPEGTMAITTFAPRAESEPNVRAMLNKVPQVTLFFWIIKILATTVGETAADFLATNLKLGLTKTTLLMGVFLAASLFFQFKPRGVHRADLLAGGRTHEFLRHTYY
jgi:uncharacterized membrane-anchored protein